MKKIVLLRKNEDEEVCLGTIDNHNAVPVYQGRNGVYYFVFGVR